MRSGLESGRRNGEEKDFDRSSGSRSHKLLINSAFMLRPGEGYDEEFFAFNYVLRDLIWSERLR